MSGDAPGHGNETLIIKRGGGHHDEHHGGVWKIAFADFMTAMMAFFLVMWLLSANDKTKATIAKYFNPIELVDSTPQPVGLNDTKKDAPNVERKGAQDEAGAETKEKAPAEKQGKGAAPSPEKAEPRPADQPPLDDAEHSAKHDEMDVLRDPYAVIAEIAAKTSVQPPRQATPAAEHAAGGQGAAGARGGDAFRDPFEPLPVAANNPFASPLPADPASPPTAPAPDGSHAEPANAAAPSPAAPDAAPAPATTQAASAPGEARTPREAVPPTEAARADAAPPGAAHPPAAPDAAPADDKPLAPAALRNRIAALARSAEGGVAGPRVDVRKTEEGTLISLTDSVDFSMFAIASARPSPKAVALMGRIGHLLQAQKGGVTIRGFTDSRPYRSDTYDNWRLSTERAHLAQYMLERGGLDGSRIDRIEGYADRRPKNPKDPEAAENRRIEILLRNQAPGSQTP